MQYSVVFEEIKETILALRETLDKTLASVPIYGRSAPEIHHGLKIDRTLAWKLSKLILEDNVFQASTHMPGRSAISSLLKSLKKSGVSAENVKKIRELADNYFKQVTIHAGDRASFDMMMLSMSDTGMEQAYQSQKRAQYSANSYLLGIQSTAHFTSWFYHPTKDNTSIDNVVLRGIIDLERKRAKAPFVLASLFHGDSEGKEISDLESVPLEAADDSLLGSHGFLFDFCTKPLPAVLNVQEADNQWIIQLADGPIGKTNRITLVTADVYPSSEDEYSKGEIQFFEVQTRVKTPTKAVVIDVFLHSSLVTSTELISDVCQDFTDSNVVVPISKRSPETIIPCYSSIKHIGSGINVVETRFLPNYGSMVDKVYSKMGWDEKEMHLFRITVEYPVTPSSVYIRIPIPEKKES